MTTIVELETHRLSDGGMVRVTRLGREYGFMRSYPDMTAPDCTWGLRKSEALKMCADTIRDDVLEY